MSNRPEHGGPDGEPITHDFSTNASPLGPPPWLARAIAQADRSRYPDPAYRDLRAVLGAAHGLGPSRVFPTAGSSEAIRRLTLAARLRGIDRVSVPSPGYADYAAAAHALSMRVDTHGRPEELLEAVSDREIPALVWICEPCNPTGESLPAAFWHEFAARAAGFPGAIALDRAYEALRLVASDPVPADIAQRTWQCHSPNKSLGLTGLRAGYMLAPAEDAAGLAAHIEALAPSWVLSAEGVALLDALHQPRTQAWLRDVRAALGDWAAQQRDALARLGWQQEPSSVPFWLAQPLPQDRGSELPARLQALRAAGIKLRDAQSFGLAGWVRVSTQPPASQQALVEAWRAIR